MNPKVVKPAKPKRKNGNGKHVSKPPPPHPDLEQLHRAGKML